MVRVWLALAPMPLSCLSFSKKVGQLQRKLCYFHRGLHLHFVRKFSSYFNPNFSFHVFTRDQQIRTVLCFGRSVQIFSFILQSVRVGWFGRVSRNPAWPGTPYVSEARLELLTLPPPCPKCWFYGVHSQPGSLRMSSRDSDNSLQRTGRAAQRLVLSLTPKNLKLILQTHSLALHQAFTFCCLHQEFNLENRFPTFAAHIFLPQIEGPESRKGQWALSFSFHNLLFLFTSEGFTGFPFLFILILLLLYLAFSQTVRKSSDK